MGNNNQPISISKLIQFAAEVLKKYKVSDDQAKTIAEVLVIGEARGFSSHGLLRLQNIIKGINAKTHCLQAEPIFNQKGKAVLSVDGQYALGPSLAYKVTQNVIATSKEIGISAAVVKSMTHFGIAGYYTDLIAEQGLIGLAFCNTQPATSPFGGKKKVLGTNPIAFSCPRRDQDPITIDMATTAAARGKILAALQNDEKLPDYIAADRDGKMTHDPQEALDGFLMPLGGMFGYKGTALAIMVDVLTGVLAGAQTASRVTGTVKTDDFCSAGYFFLALNPEFFTNRDSFYQEIENLVSDILSAGDDVKLPGSREHQNQRNAEKNGVQLSAQLIEQLTKLGDECGVRF